MTVYDELNIPVYCGSEEECIEYINANSQGTYKVIHSADGIYYIFMNITWRLE